MGARKLSQLTVIGLVLLGLVLIGVRKYSRQATTAARENSLWQLSYDITYTPGTPETTVSIALPTATDHAKILSEEFQHAGGTDDIRRYVSGTREFISTTHQLDPTRVSAEFKIELTPDASSGKLSNLVSLGEAERTKYLKQDDPQIRVAAQQELQRISGKSQSEEELLQTLFDFCSYEIRRSNQQSASASVTQIFGGSVASPLGRARTMVALCRAARMPARMVTGFEIRQQDEVTPHVWLEVFRGNHWAPFDPENGFARYMPANFIPVRRGGESIVPEPTTSVITGLTTDYKIRRLAPSQEVLDASAPHLSQVFDLTRLPVSMHHILSLLLLLPLGALITALFRNVIGIQTYGTFSPALLAMSFIYADWTTGVVVFLVIVCVGLIGRSFLERLHLLMVPRLSIILTLIILCILFGVSLVTQFFGSPSTSAVLLPLVILTMMIERFYVSAEEDGVRFAMQLVIGTFVVAAFCYLLLRWKEIGDLILVYPEAHLLTLAGFIIIGRYAGYRLTELWRFRDLVKKETPQQSPLTQDDSATDLTKEGEL